MHSELVYLNLFSAVYYLALIAYLLIQRKQYFGSLTLIGIMATNAYVLFNNSLILSGKMLHVSFVFWFTFIFVTLFPVFFRWHIHKLLQKKIKIDLLTLSLIGLWALAIYNAVNFYSLNESDQALYLSNILERKFPTDFSLLNAGFYTINLAFFIETGFTVFKKAKNMELSYGNIFIQSRKYVRQFWLLMVGMYCLVMPLYFFIPEFYIEYAAIPIALSVLFLFFVINLRMYSITYSPELDEVEKEPLKEYSTDLLSLIEQEMAKAENFTDTSFNLEKMAALVNRTKNEVSATINNGLQIGFNDFLNSKRIEFSKLLLKDFDAVKDTIEGVGYESGFNSKASFYRSFKKFTSMTPTEFIDNFNS